MEIPHDKWHEKLYHPDLRAGGVIRLAALFYDIVIHIMILFMVAGGTTIWMMIQTKAPFIADQRHTRDFIWTYEFHLFVVNWVILGSVFIFVQIIYPTMKKQTIGMMIVDLSLAGEKEGTITRKQYLKRECLKLLLFPTFFMAFGKEKRTMYDRLSNCYLMK